MACKVSLGWGPRLLMCKKARKMSQTVQGLRILESIYRVVSGNFELLIECQIKGWTHFSLYRWKAI